MLLLILTDRHEVGLIDENIRRHQHRVGEQARGDVVRVLGGLVLELRHAAQLAELRVAAEHPRKLRVLGHMALNEHDVLRGVKPAGDVLRELVDRAAAQVGGILAHGDGVHIHDAVQAVVLLLQAHPVLDGAHVGAERQLAAGLDAAENSLFDRSVCFHNGFPRFYRDWRTGRWKCLYSQFDIIPHLF